MSRFLPRAVAQVLDGVAAPMARVWYTWAHDVNAQIDSMPWAKGGKLLSDQVLAVGNNDLEHGLGRAASGYVVVKSSAATTTYGDVTGSNPDVTTYIRINSSAIATVDVWVW